MSIEKRKNRKKAYVARVYVGRENGKPKHRSKSFTKKRDAEEYEAKYKAFKNNTHEINVSDKTLFDVVFEQFLTSIEETRKDNTRITYKSNYYKWISPHLGHFQIGNINYLTIQRFITKIKEKGASDYICSYSTIVLNEIFKYATNPLERYVIENPISFLKKTSLEYNPSKIKYWVKESVAKALNSILGSHYYPIISLIMNSGLRFGEAAALTEESFDFEAGVVNVNIQLASYNPKSYEEKFSGPTLVISKTKTSATRSVPLNPMAIKMAKILIERAKREDNKFLLTAGTSEKKVRIVIKRGAVCKVIHEKTLSTKAFGNVMKSLAKTNDLTQIGTHGCRHSFAANYLMNGGDIYVLKDLLGHKDIKSTEIYSHLSSKYLKSAIKIVNFGG